jgi:hypothetical protein
MTAKAKSLVTVGGSYSGVSFNDSARVVASSKQPYLAHRSVYSVRASCWKRGPLTFGGMNSRAAPRSPSASRGAGPQFIAAPLQRHASAPTGPTRPRCRTPDERREDRHARGAARVRYRRPPAIPVRTPFREAQKADSIIATTDPLEEQ